MHVRCAQSVQVNWLTQFRPYTGKGRGGRGLITKVKRRKIVEIKGFKFLLLLRYLLICWFFYFDSSRIVKNKPFR